jgi:hypothetical protein
MLPFRQPGGELECYGFFSLGDRLARGRVKRPRSYLRLRDAPSGSLQLRVICPVVAELSANDQ